MPSERSGEFFVLDRDVWDEIPDRRVLASGYVYVGTKYLNSQVRVFVKKGEK